MDLLLDTIKDLSILTDGSAEHSVFDVDGWTLEPFMGGDEPPRHNHEHSMSVLVVYQKYEKRRRLTELHTRHKSNSWSSGLSRLL